LLAAFLSSHSERSEESIDCDLQHVRKPSTFIISYRKKPDECRETSARFSQLIARRFPISYPAADSPHNNSSSPEFNQSIKTDC
jgi:hypothetical protein